MDVDVRIKFGTDEFTTTFERFNYFSVTDSRNTVAFGPGLGAGNNAGTKTRFRIQAMDSHEHHRVTGGDEWDITVHDAHDKPLSDELQTELGMQVHAVMFSCTHTCTQLLIRTFEDNRP
jgi:hypothetical protein